MMHHKFTSNAVFIGLCVLAVLAILLSGCSKSEDVSSGPPPAPGMGPGAPGMPPGPPGVPGPPSPGGPTAGAPAPGPPGMPTGPGMPPGVGGPPPPGQAAAPTPGPTAPTAAPSQQIVAANQVALNKVPLKSAIKRVKLNSGDHLQFKYMDHNGQLSYCEMPAAEAKQPRSKDEWISTFDFYKTDMPTAKSVKKQAKESEEIPGYLFVSPPPRKR